MSAFGIGKPHIIYRLCACREGRKGKHEDNRAILENVSEIHKSSPEMRAKLTSLLARQLRGEFNERLYQIRFVVRLHVLHNRGDTLEAHACIY